MSQIRDGADAVIKHHTAAVEAACAKAIEQGHALADLELRSANHPPPGILSADELTAGGKVLAVVISRASLAPASKRMSVGAVTEWATVTQTSSAPPQPPPSSRR